MAPFPVLTKFWITLREFAKSTPDPRQLWASRNPQFDRLHLVAPSDAVAGEHVDLTVQAWDRYERLYADPGRHFDVESTDGDADLPDDVSFDEHVPDWPGVTRTPVTFETPGVHYVTLTGPGGDRYVSNPVRVHGSEPDERLYWGDLHLHSRLSDGAGTMAKGMRFGRDVMDLDVVAYTDHDTMGFFIPPSLQRKRMRERYFREMKDVTGEFHDPGEFVTLFGYEWTQQPNVGGHVNVYFDGVEDAELFDSLSAESNTYETLWDRLRAWRGDGDGDVLTVPHHPAESTYPFDFSAVAYDDDLAPLVEVHSQWGSSEQSAADGNEMPVTMGSGEMDEPGHYFQDALALGHRVGAMASSDYHGPHPGHSLLHAPAHLPSLGEWREDGLGWGLVWRVWNEKSYPGGQVAFRAPELTREAVFDALRSRAVYGTSQPHRIRVAFDVDGTRPGDDDSTLDVDGDRSRTVSVDVAGTEPIARVVVLKNNEPWRVVEGTDDPDAGLDAYTVEAAFEDDAPVEGMQFDADRGTGADAYYVRVEQVARERELGRELPGGRAWAGPVWVEG